MPDMQADTLTLTESMSAFEFEVACTTRINHDSAPQDPVCDDPAVWATIGRCCGVYGYKCARHLSLIKAELNKYGMFCTACKQFFPRGTLLEERFTIGSLK